MSVKVIKAHTRINAPANILNGPMVTLKLLFLAKLNIEEEKAYINIKFFCI